MLTLWISVSLIDSDFESLASTGRAIVLTLRVQETPSPQFGAAFDEVRLMGLLTVF